jgi:hypothetical protein
MWIFCSRINRLGSRMGENMQSRHITGSLLGRKDGDELVSASCTQFRGIGSSSLHSTYPTNFASIETSSHLLAMLLLRVAWGPIWFNANANSLLISFTRCHRSLHGAAFREPSFSGCSCVVQDVAENGSCPGLLCRLEQKVSAIVSGSLSSTALVHYDYCPWLF